MLRALLAALSIVATLALVPGESAASPNGKTFVLFDKTWCIGEVSPLTRCDVSLGRAATARRMSASERLNSPDPIDALRQTTHRAARTTATPLVDLHKLEERLQGKTQEPTGVR